MPFVRGRYHINPVMGEALEAAREAEEALLALQQEAQQDGADEKDDALSGQSGPIHRVEIEAAELVRPHAGRAERGFAVRVHRHPAVNADDDASSDDDNYVQPPAQPSPAQHLARVFAGQGYANAAPSRGAANAETHIFSNHGDMLDFLRNELEKDRGK